jgi:regulator of protease activity HflC (stomatin/prohibitin superfamily)
MMNKSSYLLVFAALIVGIAFNSFFIVDEKEKAIVLQFGEAC